MSNLLTFADVMSKIGGVLAALLMLLAMVTVHEFGHYVMGKILGFKITEFAVGFGPAIFKKRSKKSGEKFSLRLIPLGGYCAFDGEDDDDEAYGGYYENLKKKKLADGENKEERAEEVVSDTQAEIDSLFSAIEEEPNPPTVEEPVEEILEESAPLEKVEEEVQDEKKGKKKRKKKQVEYPEPKGERFNNQPPWKRILVLISGAAMNYVLAVVLTFVMMVGYGAPRYKVEFSPTNPPSQDFELDENESGIIGGDMFAEFQEEAQPQPQEMAIEVGDVVLKIDRHRLYLITDYISALDGKKAGEKIVVTILRDGEKIEKEWTLPADIEFANMSDTNPIFTALGLGEGYALRTCRVRLGFFGTIGGTIEYSFKLGGVILRSLGELLTLKVGCNSLGGPITTITATAEMVSYGFDSFLNMAALIGANLAIFNLLPVPALDGSKVVFCIIEWIRKKPVNRKVEAIIHFVGIIAIFGFAIIVDLLHLF